MNDDVQFKEEILKNIRDFQEDLLDKINKKLIELNADYKKFHNNLNNLSESNKQLIDSLINKNINMEKIASLEQFRNKVDSILITHEIRINNNIEEISSIKSKYDKALLENLLVPGYVGPSCQFKNIGDYIIFNINEVSKIKSEKEFIRNSFKDLRIKTDSSMRTVLSLNESSIRRCNDYADNRIDELKKLLSEKIEFMNTKEKEIKEMIKNWKDEQDILEKNKQNFKNELKEEMLSDIDIKINEIKKNQEDAIYKAVNQNNNFMESYVNQIFENKIKTIQDNILDIQNKITNIYKDKDNYKDKENKSNIIKQNKNINNNNIFPLVPSLSQKSINNLKFEKMEEKITNRNDYNENFKQNITYTNSNINKNNEIIENYKPNKTFSNLNNINMVKKNETNIKDFNAKINEIKLISNKINQKNILKYNNNEQENKFKEIQSTYNIEKSIDSAPIVYKEKDQSDILLKNKNSKILIYNYEHKNHNTKLPISKPNIKKPLNNNKFMKNLANLKTFKNENNNKDLDVIDCGSGDEKTFRNLIDDLQTPKILERRILSSEEIKKNHDKSHNLNQKYNFKNELNNSGGGDNFKIKNKNFSPPLKNEYKTLDNWKKASKNWRSERNIKMNKDKENGCNFVRLELKKENNFPNGATILASKKIMNNHITKMGYPNSFACLYNIQIINKNNQNKS